MGVRIEAALDDDGFAVTGKSQCQIVLMWRRVDKSNSEPTRMTMHYDEKLGYFHSPLFPKARAGAYEVWLAEVLTEKEVYVVSPISTSFECGLPLNSSRTCPPLRITVMPEIKTKFQIIIGGSSLAFD